MPTKSTPDGRWTYQIDGKRFTWTATIDDADGAEAEVAVVLPMRLKAKLLRKLATGDDDIEVIFDIIEAVAPQHLATADEMDMTELSVMFATWQREYAALAGASLGESEGSST
ncbi:MAG: hypothetical protein ACRCZP_11730 [Phycicoccus sp.]